MYFNDKSKPNNGILQIDDNFASLVNVTGESLDPRSQVSANELQFEFTYKLSQIKAIEENTFSVRITLRTKARSRPTIVASRKLGKINTDKLIDNILTYRTRVNNVSQNEKSEILVQKESDITAKINNQVLSKLKTGQSLDDVGIQKNRIIVQKIQDKDSEETQVSGLMKNSVGHVSIANTPLNLKDEFRISTRETIADLIKNKSLPPSAVVDVTDRLIGTHNSMSGLIRKNSYPEYTGSPLTKLINSYVFQGQGTNSSSEYVTSLGQVYDDTIVVKAKVSIPNGLNKSSKNQFSSIVNVKFELLQTTNDSGVRQVFPIETIEKELNVDEHLKNYFMPIHPPTVTAVRTGHKVVLQIKQNDDKSSGVKIYKKPFSINNSDMMSSYQLIDQIGLSKESGIASYVYTNLNEESVIYRVIPYNKFASDFLPSIFSDALINNNPYKSSNKKLVIIPRLTETGVSVTAYNTLPGVVAARLLFKDVTKRQKKYGRFSQTFSFSSANDESNLVLMNLTPYHTYQLTTMIIEKNGIETMSSYSTLFEYVPFTGNPFDISISEETNTGNDFQFTVNANLIQDQVGTFKQLLSQVNATYDEAQLSARKANYDRFISFSVVRHNIITGDVENLGIIPNGTTFVDSQRSKLYSAMPLTYNHKYKYILSPLVREPETVISQQKEKRDPETRKKYIMNPRKHMHPTTLIKGSVVPKRVIEEELDPKDDNLYGFIGTTYVVDASMLASRPSISSFSAALLRENKVYLSWTVQGDQNLIDHLIIATEIDGARRIIGKAHTLSREQATFTYDLTKNDIGYVKFVIIPVFNDFSTGKASLSNPLLITLEG